MEWVFVYCFMLSSLKVGVLNLLVYSVWCTLGKQSFQHFPSKDKASKLG